MDGNGRYAERQGLIRIEGHKAGVLAVKETIKACLFHHIPYLSLFAFSSENWSRPQEEVEFLMGLFLQALNQEVDELNTNGVRLQFTGNRLSLSAALQEEMQVAESKTAKNQKLHLNIVVNYGGKWEIVEATKAIVHEALSGQLSLEAIDETCFSKHLCTAHFPEPDLFIRTGGEKRLSNFFLWSLAYTELYFSDCLWPEFTQEVFSSALAAYALRERRFGQTSQQLQEGQYV